MNWIVAVLTILTLWVGNPTLHTSVEQTSQPLVIVVRDGQGSPLAGITLVMLRTGPPHESFDNCVTDSEGQCRLQIPPGAYIVQFDGGWRGQMFVPVGQQNGGALEDGGATGGGFGIYVEPASVEQIVTFVVGQRDGQLIPLWDMSRDPAAPPQPFAVSANPFDPQEDPLAGIDLSGLGGGAISATASAGTAQVVESEIETGGVPTLTPSQAPTLPATTSGGVPPSGILLGLIALAVMVIIIVGVVIIVIQLRARRKQNG